MAASSAEAQAPMERLRESVEKNPLDFNSWVQLLALVESETSVTPETVAATYDRFLIEFPLCFGYWNKYAQYQYALGSKPSADGSGSVLEQAEATKRAIEVYERGVEAVRFSVDMWAKYCEFLIQTVRVPVDEARAVLERALAACGGDPMAGPLWDAYIQLETLNNDMIRLNQVFKRIMYQSLSNLDEFWDKYNHFVLAQQLQTLATTDEINAISGEDDMMDEGLLRVKIVNSVEGVKNKTAESIYRRQGFEDAIDRSYFHVTPVSDAALKNWHAYLDYEEVAGNPVQCEFLYERCLISCANYEEMWTRYALWKEKAQGFDAADAVFQRAVTIFLKHRASMYLAYAAFLEANGKIDAAKGMYMKVLTDIAPQLAEAFIKYCNFERRRGDFETVKVWFEKAMVAVKSQSDVFAYVVTTYANFLQRIVRDVDHARRVFQSATESTSDSLLLWANYVHFEANVTGAESDFVERVEKVYLAGLAESTDLSNDGKNDLWFQYIEFMQMYAPDAAAVRAAEQNEIAWKRKNALPRDRSLKQLCLEPASNSVSSYENYETGMKRPRYEDPATTAAAAAPQVATAVATGAVPAATTADAYAQYYQGYQAYGSQGYSTDATAAAATQVYTPAQYAAYYQQQQQQQQH